MNSTVVTPKLRNLTLFHPTSDLSSPLVLSPHTLTFNIFDEGNSLVTNAARMDPQRYKRVVYIDT